MDLTKQRKDYQREAKTKDTQYSTVNTEKSKWSSMTTTYKNSKNMSKRLNLTTHGIEEAEPKHPQIDNQRVEINWSIKHTVNKMNIAIPISKEGDSNLQNQKM